MFRHLRDVNEPYFTHLRFAFGCGLRLLGAGFAAIAHALLPCCFEKTASTTIARLHECMAHRTPPK